MEREKDKDEIIEIFSGTLWESEMVKSLLQAADIESFLKNNVLNTYAFDTTTTANVKVMILNSDLAQAKEIVDDYYNNMKKE
jgi:hypothetical protein